MKPREPVATGQQDMFRSRLDQIIDMRLEKVVLAGAIDWQFLSRKCGEGIVRGKIITCPHAKLAFRRH